MDPIDRPLFYDRIRQRPFGGRLRQTQVAGCETILDYWEAAHCNADDRWLAYLLGTAFHETAGTMAAIHEYGGAAYFERRYGAHTAIGKALGNREAGDGARYHGRGFVQLTGRANYADWAERLKMDLIGQPDLALQAGVAARILVDGAILGTFTGRRLGDYLAADRNDWTGARRVINRLDRAGRIAELAEQFWAALSHRTTGQSRQLDHRPTLCRGDRGETVRFVQLLLGQEQDGCFGPATAAAVEMFQIDAGLAADGIIGRRTWRALLTPAGS